MLNGLLKDWKRWTLAERVLAIFLIAGILLLQVPLIL
jgi:competence protein ComGF